MPFHRDSAKEIEKLVQTYQHQEKEKLTDQTLYQNYFNQYLKKKEKQIKNVLDYLYTVDGIIPFFLKGLLGEAPKFSFESYSYFLNKIQNELDDPSIVYSKLYNILEINKDEFEANKNDFYILFKNISYFEYKLNIVFDIVFERLAKNASILPEFIIAKIASIALTPYMCANIVRFMKENQILSLMKHFEINFLTDVVNELDTKIALKLISSISNNQLEEIFKTMLHKGYYQKIVNIFENYNGNIDIYKEALKKYIAHQNHNSKQEIIEKISPYFVNKNKLSEFVQMLNI